MTINEIEKMLNNEKLIDLKRATNEIEEVESNLLQKLFQNKSILFRKHSNVDQSEEKIINGQLVLADEFISQESIDEK